MIEGEATVKRYYPGGRPDPVPAGELEHGADHRAHERTSSRVDIIGIVVGVYRKLLGASIRQPTGNVDRVRVDLAGKS